VSECAVVIFPDDRALWPPDSTRYIRSSRPADDGRFKVDSLPAGTYQVVAIEWLEPGDENDPDLLEQLRPLGTRVTVGWGDTRDLSLTLTKFERR